MKTGPVAKSLAQSNRSKGEKLKRLHETIFAKIKPLIVFTTLSPPDNVFPLHVVGNHRIVPHWLRFLLRLTLGGNILTHELNQYGFRWFLHFRIWLMFMCICSDLILSRVQRGTPFEWHWFLPRFELFLAICHNFLQLDSHLNKWYMWLWFYCNAIQRFGWFENSYFND